MEAGFGAEEQATRKARKLERLRRERDAAGQVDSAVSAEIGRLEDEKRRWAQGAEGERLVADALAALSRFGWTAVHDVHWPGRPQANIDHIAIGPGGVVVIDAKNWSGDVTVRDGELRQNGHRRAEEAAGAVRASDAVTALLAPQHRMSVAPMICLVAQDHAAARVEPGVVVVGRHQLASTLVGLPQRLTPYEVADLGRYLQAALGGDRSPALMTTAALDGVPHTPASRRAARGTSRSSAVRPRPERAGGPNTSKRRSSAGDGFGRLLVTLGALAGILWLISHALPVLLARAFG